MTEQEPIHALGDATRSATARWQSPEIEVMQTVVLAVQAIEEAADRLGLSPEEALIAGRQAALAVLGRDTRESAWSLLNAWGYVVETLKEWPGVEELLRQAEKLEEPPSLLDLTGRTMVRSQTTPLEWVLNTTDEQDRRALFADELSLLGPFMPHDWNLPAWKLDPEPAPEITTQEFFDRYSQWMDLLQRFAAALIAPPDPFPEDLLNDFDLLLEEVRLSVRSERGMRVRGFTPLLGSCAVALWQVHQKSANFMIGRCAYEPCGRFFVGSQHKEYCSDPCRMAASRYGRDDHKRKRSSARFPKLQQKK